MTKARDLADIAGAIANDKIPSSKLDVSFENISDTGTTGTKVAAGTTAQRGSTTGQFRYNSTIDKFEGRNASSFVTLEVAPVISSINVTEVDSTAGGNQTFVLTGNNFSTGDIASFIGSDATTFNATSTTVDSATQITAVAARSSFANAKEPYDVKVTSTGGSSGVLADQINVDSSPTWTTNAGSLGSIREDATGNHFTVAASDAEGDTIAYSLQSGSLAGLSLNSSSGVISGDPTDVTNDTTNSFTLRATANGKTADRAFSYITTNYPLAGITEIYNSNTSGIAGLTAAGGVVDVTSNIATITGVSGWTGTRLHYLADGNNCANWTNIVGNMASSGGVTITYWGKLITSNIANYRSFDWYGRVSEYTNYRPNHYQMDWHYNTSNPVDMRTLTGNNSYSMSDWHFHAFRYADGVTASSQQAKYTTDSANNGTLHTLTTTNSNSNNSQASGAGFMGYDPSGGGANSYNFEGYTGIWRVFNAELTDAQITYLYNSGNGRI